jgi:lysyl-tRNA synthetase, class II
MTTTSRSEVVGPSRPLGWRPLVPAVVAWTVRAAAVFSVVAIWVPSPGRAHYTSRVMDGVVDGATFAVAVVAAGAMMLLAAALRRRKRRAWNFTVVAVLVGALAHVGPRGWPVVAVNVAVLALLVWARSDFTARSERTSRLTALRVFAVMTTISLVSGLLLTTRTAPRSSLATRFVETCFGLIGFTPELAFRRSYGSLLTEMALNSLGALTMLLTLVALLAPARKVARLTVEAEERLRGLLLQWGHRDSLGYFALRGDKSAVFSPSGKAAVVHRVVGGVSLASGDPIGDPEAWPQAIEAWLAEADDYAWEPGVIAASEAGAVAYGKAGLDSLELGDEAVLELSEFSLQGRSMRAVRQAVNRVARAGYTLTIDRQKDLPPEKVVELVRLADALRGQEVERGFSMALGRIGDERDGDLVVADCRDSQGRTVAVLTFVPWGADGLSLDLMRRSRDSENGTVEFIVTALVAAAPGLGVHRISLNFAAFRSVFERGSRVGAGPVLRLWHRVLLLASRWWQIESLYRANVKYAPDWVPRFICFRRAAALPRVGLAALEAEAYLERPRLRWLAR